jgi:hypothetical protein
MEVLAVDGPEALLPVVFIALSAGRERTLSRYSRYDVLRPAPVPSTKRYSRYTRYMR